MHIDYILLTVGSIGVVSTIAITVYLFVSKVGRLVFQAHGL